MTDDDDAVVVRAMGRRVRAALVRFVEHWNDTCQHADRPQFAAVADSMSACLDCVGGHSALTGCAAGPCDLCGRLPDRTPDRLWWITPVPNVALAVRVCDTCAAADVRPLDEEEPMTSQTACSACSAAWLTASALTRPMVVRDLHDECVVAMRRDVRTMTEYVPDDRQTRIDVARLRFALQRGTR